MVSDKFDETRNEKDSTTKMTPSGNSEGNKALAEEKASGTEAKKALDEGKKPVKKKKIIIVTGGNTQGGQRGAYSSGSGAKEEASALQAAAATAEDAREAARDAGAPRLSLSIN